MGLDVYLCQFKDVDAEAILKLSRFVDAWTAMPKAEKGSLQEVIRKTRELGLPEDTTKQPLFAGTHISFSSKQHPELSVGDWYSFGLLRGLIQQFTGKDIYFIFPEAMNDPSFLRPNWLASKKRSVDVLNELQQLKPVQMEDFHEQFVTPNIPPHYLEKIKPTQLATSSEIFTGRMAQLEVVIETLDYVLNHERPHEFLLRWSA